jgi:hypothetical protein
MDLFPDMGWKSSIISAISDKAEGVLTNNMVEPVAHREKLCPDEEDDPKGARADTIAALSQLLAHRNEEWMSPPITPTTWAKEQVLSGEAIGKSLASLAKVGGGNEVNKVQVMPVSDQVTLESRKRVFLYSKLSFHLLTRFYRS